MGKKNDQTVPEWAAFMNEAEFNKFMQEVDKYFNSNNINYSVDDGVIVVSDERFGADRLGLPNLAQSCRQYDQSDWAEIIEGHFTGLQRASKFSEEFDEKSHDFDYVKDFLAVRLYHKSYLDQGEDFIIIGKEITEDIFATLVFDFPDSVSNVRPEQTIQWNKTNEELFELGLQNVRNKYEFEISEQLISDITFQIVSGDHFFVANIIFDIDNYPEFIGKYGSLLSVPTRHTVVIYPIETEELLTALNTIIPVTHGVNEDGPGSISNQLYWYKDGGFINLPYELNEEGASFSPPQSFLDLMDSFEE